MKPEAALQKQCIALLAYAVDPIWWTAINPVPAKSKAVAGLSKMLGMRAGAPDLIVIHRGRFIGIEFKASKGRVSEAQKAVRVEIIEAGGLFSVVKSVEEFTLTLAAFGVDLRARIAA